MNHQSKIRVNFLGKDVNVNLKDDIVYEVSKRMIENGCPEGSSVTFYFKQITINKRASGVYISRVQAVDILVVIKHSSNESVKGNLKPGFYADGKKMTVSKLEGYLKPVITKKSIPSKSFDSTIVPPVPDPASEHDIVSTQSSEKILYSQDEILAPDFKTLFLEYLPIVFQEAGKNALAARDIAPIFNESASSFCESGKSLGIRLLGILLGHLHREGYLEMVNNGKPYAIYKLSQKKIQGDVEKIPEEVSLPVLTQTKTPVSVLNNIEDLKSLLKQKKAIEERKQIATRDVLLAREALTKAESELNQLENVETKIDIELEQYRELYQALNGVFS